MSRSPGFRGFIYMLIGLLGLFLLIDFPFGGAFFIGLAVVLLIGRL